VTSTFAAQVDQWVSKSKRRIEAVVRQATGDMIADIEVAPGINRGGARTRGTIPRDLGTLAASLQSNLYGSTSMTQSGEASYAFVVGAMEAGDVATFTWGGPAASYAAAVHYGANSVPGTFWVDEAASKWQGYVSEAAARAKAEVN